MYFIVAQLTHNISHCTILTSLLQIAGEDARVAGKPGLDGDGGTHGDEGHVDASTSRLKLDGNDVRHNMLCCFPIVIVQILTCFVTSNTSTLLFEGHGGS